MMSTTHAAMALAATSWLVWVAPEFAVVAALAAYAGGVAPDFDVVASHRKTLHFPVYAWLPTALAVVLAVVAPTNQSIAVAAFLWGGALHAVIDQFGGGLGPRPWRAADDRGVYNHFSSAWLEPRRWVRYDGAPEDLLLAVACSAVGLLAFEGIIEAVLLGGARLSAGYTVIRKRLPEFAAS